MGNVLRLSEKCIQAAVLSGKNKQTAKDPESRGHTKRASKDLGCECSRYSKLPDEGSLWNVVRAPIVRSTPKDKINVLMGDVEEGKTQVCNGVQKQEPVNTRVLHNDAVIGETWRRILSWNLNGVRSRLKDGSFRKAIVGFDVLYFSEFRCPRKTFFRKKDVRDKLAEMGFRFWAEHVDTR